MKIEFKKENLIAESISSTGTPIAVYFDDAPNPYDEEQTKKLQVKFLMALCGNDVAGL